MHSAHGLAIGQVRDLFIIAHNVERKGCHEISSNPIAGGRDDERVCFHEEI